MEGESQVLFLFQQAETTADPEMKLMMLQEISQRLAANKILVPTFYPKVLGFANDSAVFARVFVAKTIGETCRDTQLDASSLILIYLTSLDSLLNLIKDPSITVQKEAIASSCFVFHQIFKFLCQIEQWQHLENVSTPDSQINLLWKATRILMDRIVIQIDPSKKQEKNTEGALSCALKFAEKVILAWTPSPSDQTPSANDISLDLLKQNHPLLSPYELRQQARNHFSTFIKSVAGQRTSSVVMGSLNILSNLAKQRPEFVVEIVQCCLTLSDVSLFTNIQARTHLTSIKHCLKQCLLSIMKVRTSSASMEEVLKQSEIIIQALYEVSGGSNSLKEYAQQLQMRLKQYVKGSVTIQKPFQPSKRGSEQVSELADEEPEDIATQQPKRVKEEPLLQPDAIVEAIVSSVPQDRVVLTMVELIIQAMQNFPPSIPSFMTQPSATSGTTPAIKDPRLLGAPEATPAKSSGKAVKAEVSKVKEEPAVENLAVNKRVNLEEMSNKAIHRIMNPFTEKAVHIGGKSGLRSALLIRFASQVRWFSTKQSPEAPILEDRIISKPLLDYINMDFGSRKEIAMMWLTSEFYVARNSQTIKTENGEPVPEYNRYNQIFKHLFDHLRQNLVASSNVAAQSNPSAPRAQPDAKTPLLIPGVPLSQTSNKALGGLAPLTANNLNQSSSQQTNVTQKESAATTTAATTGLSSGAQWERLTAQFLMDAPYLPDFSWTLIDEICRDPKHTTCGLTILRDVILFRPTYRFKALDQLLEYTAIAETPANAKQDQELRVLATRLVTNKLFVHVGDSRIPENIEEFSKKLFDSLATEPETITEEEVKRRTFLFFALSTKKSALIDQIVEIYANANATVKKVIQTESIMVVRTLYPTPAGNVLINNIIAALPRKAEALIVHWLHAIAEVGHVTASLVSLVTGLFRKKLSDPRILLPVVSGLAKDELLEFLPKFLTLPTPLLKSFVSRVLGMASVLPAVDFMILLHLQDNSVLKKAIEATQMCLEHKKVFKSETLAVVLQQLIEKAPLPPLFMRTIIQAVTRYPSLVNFCMSLLSRLIPKNIWTDKRLWEGFLRCCKATQPQSFGVLIRLPAPQLDQVLQMKDFEGLPEYVKNFNLGKANVPISSKDAVVPLPVSENSNNGSNIPPVVSTVMES